MKKFFIISISLFILVGCSSNKKELYKITDEFVESLSTIYESYGVLSGDAYSRSTSDKLYTITPIGRLINVKILKAASEKEYESLRADLADHYKNDHRVNNVYICNAGTVMIDCRN